MERLRLQDYWRQRQAGIPHEAGSAHPRYGGLDHCPSRIILFVPLQKLSLKSLGSVFLSLQAVSASSCPRITLATVSVVPVRRRGSLSADVLSTETSLSCPWPLSRRESKRFPVSQYFHLPWLSSLIIYMFDLFQDSLTRPFPVAWDPSVAPRSASCSTFLRKTM